MSTIPHLLIETNFVTDRKMPNKIVAGHVYIYDLNKKAIYHIVKNLLKLLLFR